MKLHSSDRESREKALLYELERYIRLHFATVTSRELETTFHYHRNYYNLLLQKYLGVSFQEYLQDIRMKQAAQHAPSRQGYRPCGRLSQQQPFPSSVPAAFRHVPGRLPGCPSFGRPGLTCPYAPWRRRRNSTDSSRYSLPSARSTASMPRGTVHRSKIR